MEKSLAAFRRYDTTRATASLPGLEIEIVHRRPRADDHEALSINLQAMPSFEAVGRFREAANPFVFWAQAMQMAWLPWLQATRALTAPWGVAGASLVLPLPENSANTDAKGR